jgi:acyl-CoA hydrolase
MKKKLSKIPSASETDKTEIVCPNDTNPMGILMGGRLVEWMDIAAAVSAQRHARQVCVTASIDKVSFIQPARKGDIITIKARPSISFNSSIVVHVIAFAWNNKTGKKWQICEADFIFVALDENGRPTTVPAVSPVTSKDKINYTTALKNRNHKSKSL